MLKRWDATACLGNLLKIQLRQDYLGRRPALCQNLAPGGDYEAMAIGFAPIRMGATLGGCDHKCPVLNRPRAQKHMPMRLAGHTREGGGNAEHVGPRLRQHAIEMRK